MTHGLSAATLAAAAHLALTLFLIAWTIDLGGRIARHRDAPRALMLLSGLGALLIAPAAFVEAMTGSVITGRALYAVAWLWPVTCLAMVAQSAYATVRGLVPRSLGAAITAYNVLVAGIAVVRYAMLLGAAPAEALVTLSAAGARALEVAAGSLATGRSFFLFPPVLAAGVPVRPRGPGVLVRGAGTTVILVWSALLLIAVPPALHSVRSFRAFARERLQERPADDFAIGVRLFPVVDGLGPPDLPVERDVQLARDLGLTALSVFVAPGSVTEAGLDSIARAIDEPRRAGAVLVAVLAASDALEPATPHDDRWQAARLREVEAVVRRLRPDYFVPAAPAVAARRIGVDAWVRYVDAAARTSRRTRPRTRVMLGLSGFATRDSVLYEWARRPNGSVDAVGFRFAAGIEGGALLQAELLAAERWMRLTRGRPLEHWVLEAGTWPSIFGDRNHQRAVWGTLTWGSRQPLVRGVIVHAAADYGAPVGVRSVSGRVRPAGRVMERAVRALTEAAERAAPSPPIE